MSLDMSVQDAADAARGPVPPLLNVYVGPAKIKTYTVTYGRDGQPIEGIVVARTPEGNRVMARVPATDPPSMVLLLSMEHSGIGSEGHVSIDRFGKPAWQTGPDIDPARRLRKFCTVERDGKLTIVTINRPEAMNALTPAANAELAEVFDVFAADPDQWVAILTGAGERAFSAGPTSNIRHKLLRGVRRWRRRLPASQALPPATTWTSR